MRIPNCKDVTWNFPVLLVNSMIGKTPKNGRTISLPLKTYFQMIMNFVRKK